MKKFSEFLPLPFECFFTLLPMLLIVGAMHRWAAVAAFATLAGSIGIWIYLETYVRLEQKKSLSPTIVQVIIGGTLIFLSFRLLK